MPEYRFKITDKITLWCEVLGAPAQPKIIFIGGAGASGISLWNEIFCPGLIEQGFCVIRFDQRDTGLSSYIDFDEEPYKLSDMANDVVLLLNELNIEKVHIIGNSCGGFIAQMLAIAHPELLLSLTIISSTCDLCPVINAVTGTGEYFLTTPTPEVTQMLKACLESTSDEECQQNQLIYEPISAEDTTEHSATIQRIKSRPQNIRAGQNHLKAILRDTEHHTLDQSKLRQITTTPTLIIHGTEDQLFPLEHAIVMQSFITSSVLYTIQDMGHTIAPSFCEAILSQVIAHISAVDKQVQPKLQCE